jgi:uncharacterized cupin superfamily protein
MGRVFKVLGIIGFVIVGFFSMFSLVGGIATGRFAGILVSCLIDCIIPALLYGLGTVLEDNAEMRHNAYSTAVSDRNKQKKGIWDCECGRANAAYVTTCNCGRSKPAVVDPRSQMMSDLNALRGVKTEAYKSVAEIKWEDQENQIVTAGGWKCTCGRVNQAYISTCACGKSKAEVTEE